MILAGAVLAGGASHRMGRPKAFVEIAGQPMVVRVAAALTEAGAEPVVVIGGDSGRIESLLLRSEPDRFPGEGPLGGIVTALQVCSGAEAIAVVSCDLIAPSSIEIRTLVSELGGDDVVVPVVQDQPQWIHAVWSPRARAALEAAFTEGIRAPRNAVDSLSVRRVDVVGSRATAYADADTPADLPDELGT